MPVLSWEASPKMTERGTGGGFSLSPEDNKPGKTSPLTPQTPQSGKRDSGYLTDYSPASGTSSSRHFTFESPFPPEDEADEADEELSALGAVGGHMGGSRVSRASSITPEIDVFSPPTVEPMSGRRSRGRPRSRSSVTPDIDVFLPTPEVEEEEELAQVRFNDNLFSVVEPSLPVHMQPPNFVSRPIPIPHCVARGLAGAPRMPPGEVQGHMRYPSPASCPCTLSSSSTLHHSASSLGSPRNALMYFGHVGMLSRSIGTQTPHQHSLIIQDLIQGGIESQTFARGKD